MDLKTLLRDTAKKRGYIIGDANYFPQAHERKIYEYYLKESREISLIFDVGANIGQTALAFHESFPDAAIHSFEPFGKTYKRLLQNTAHLSNVHCQHIALGEAETTITAVSEPSNLLVNSLLDKKQQSLKSSGITDMETIYVRKGKNYCAEAQITVIDILKIDTEGYEIPVLKGFEDMLTTGVRSILCEFCLAENKEQQTPLKRLQALLYPKDFELVSLYDIRHEADGAFHYGNALFVHADHLKADRRW